MRRAAVEGVVDYSKYDPDDPWWWHRHEVMLYEFEQKLLRDFHRVQHTHHVTLASGNLTVEAIDQSIANARQTLNTWCKLQLPWEADQIGDAGAATTEEQLQKTYHELIGEPGTARYEEAMAELDKALRPMSRAETLRQRRVRHAAAEAQRQQEELERLGLAGGDA
jgi:hypothetical protein